MYRNPRAVACRQDQSSRRGASFFLWADLWLNRRWSWGLPGTHTRKLRMLQCARVRTGERERGRRCWSEHSRLPAAVAQPMMWGLSPFRSLQRKTRIRLSTRWLQGMWCSRGWELGTSLGLAWTSKGQKGTDLSASRSCTVAVHHRIVWVKVVKWRPSLPSHHRTPKDSMAAPDRCNMSKLSETGKTATSYSRTNAEISPKTMHRDWLCTSETLPGELFRNDLQMLHKREYDLSSHKSIKESQKSQWVAQ